MADEMPRYTLEWLKVSITRQYYKAFHATTVVCDKELHKAVMIATTLTKECVHSMAMSLWYPSPGINNLFIV